MTVCLHLLLNMTHIWYLHLHLLKHCRYLKQPRVSRFNLQKPNNGSTRRFVMDADENKIMRKAGAFWSALRAAKNIIHFEAEEEKSESISSLASWIYWLVRLINIIIIIVDAMADTWFKSSLSTHMNVQPEAFFFSCLHVHVRYELICGTWEDNERGHLNHAERIQPLKCVLTKAHYRPWWQKSFR